MIERTRQVASGALRPAASSNVISATVGLSETPDQPLSTKNNLQGLSRHVDGALRQNSQKYDDLMKKKKDELRRKRGALELNSDLDFDPDF